jgi:tetratricopeptide (TPR) repeat protein
MYDIKPLEEKWERYHQRKKRPWYFLGLGIFFSLFIIFFFMKSNTPNITIHQKRSKPIAQKKVSSVLLNKSLIDLELKKVKKEILIVDHSKNDLNSNNLPIDNTPIAMEIKKPVIIKKPKKKMHLNIIETTSESAYQDVATRFYATHEIDDSLFLAKSYYKKGNYKKAEYWAVETNKVNNNIEESWLIFANVKVKQKNRNEAVRILTNYIKRSNSQKAKKLLSEIKEDI